MVSNRRQREAGTEDSEETHCQSPSLEDELVADGVASDLWSESTEPTVRPDWQQRDPWGSEGSEQSMRPGWHQGPKGLHSGSRVARGQGGRACSSSRSRRRSKTL